jgi:hypothetical protein
VQSLACFFLKYFFERKALVVHSLDSFIFNFFLKGEFL